MVSPRNNDKEGDNADDIVADNLSQQSDQVEIEQHQEEIQMHELKTQEKPKSSNKPMMSPRHRHKKEEKEANLADVLGDEHISMTRLQRYLRD